jgi:hypothetical protein
MLSVRELKALATQLDDAGLVKQLGPFVLVQRPWQKEGAGIPKTTRVLKPRRSDTVLAFDELWVATVPPLSEMDSVTVGRSVDNEVVIDEESVSKRHARLDWLGDWAELQDLGSSNGTFVNGRRIDTQVRLEDDDGLAFGGVQVLFLHTASLRRRLQR